MTQKHAAVHLQQFDEILVLELNDPGWNQSAMSLSSDHARPDALHVAHVTEAPLGGVIAYLDQLLSHQIADGMQVELITPSINLDTLSKVVDGCAAVTTFDQPRRSVGSLLRLGWHSVLHIRRTRPEIVHVHSTLAGVVLRLCRPLLPRGTRMIYCPHGWATARRGSRLTSAVAGFVERALAPLANRIVCISEHERQEGLRIGIALARLALVENGIGPEPDLEEDRPRIAHDRIRIGFAGRFDRQKGFDVLVDVMRALGDDFEGVAIGSAMTERAVEGALPSNLRCMGWQPRAAVLALLRDVDVLLMPSRWEGFGLVAAEAMQVGTAVFASRVGALPDIVQDGVTGRLFTPDATEEIVSMIRNTSRETLRGFGEAGQRRYLEHYTADRMARDMAELYEDIRAS